MKFAVLCGCKLDFSDYNAAFKGNIIMEQEMEFCVCMKVDWREKEVVGPMQFRIIIIIFLKPRQNSFY